MKEFNADKVYQAIGEFVVSFQWVENRFREIGGLILDPERKNWPPLAFRNESNYNLINKVKNHYMDLMGRLRGDNYTEYIDTLKKDFSDLVDKSHSLREYRNDLLHSAFIELKTGDQILGMMKSNARFSPGDPSSYHLSPEPITVESIHLKTELLAEIAINLNRHYLQLIHWLPLEQLPENNLF
ncbi:MAG: hypothetical protein KDC73_05780 [Ignavibacteriae bacterium]|nr:hypothetical protein [Ignavibacteriota bacterium]MCB9243764.1 hypothetical protein [Ignavibacteriales bacterium]